MSFINSYRPLKEEASLPESTEPYDINFCCPFSPLLETRRVKLIPFIPSVHGEVFFAGFDANPALGRYIPVNFPTYTDFQAFVEGYIRTDPGSILFAIIDKAKEDKGVEASLAGIIGLLHTSQHHRVTEIGPIIILPEFQRSFVATNAVGAVLKYCLDIPSEGGLGLRRAAWTAHPENAASIKIAERMGLKREGLMRWMWIITPEKVGKACTGRERGEEQGRDSVMLAICWDDWENGAKEQVERLIERE